MGFFSRYGALAANSGLKKGQCVTTDIICGNVDGSNKHGDMVTHQHLWLWASGSLHTIICWHLIHWYLFWCISTTLPIKVVPNLYWRWPWCVCTQWCYGGGDIQAVIMYTRDSLHQPAATFFIGWINLHLMLAGAVLLEVNGNCGKKDEEGVKLIIANCQWHLPKLLKKIKGDNQ